MTVGTAHAGKCYPVASEAAIAWCSDMAGVASSGTLSCTGVSALAPNSTTGALTFSWARRQVSGSGAVSTGTVTGQSLVGCEVRDLDYYMPGLLAFVVALALVAAGRLVLRVVNTRDT